MSLYYKAKETVVEYAVLSVFALLGILTFIIWQAVPSTFWERISDAIEKKVLWAGIGILFCIVIGESVYLLQMHLRARTILRHYGGVLWNSNSDIFCPKDETPLYKSGDTFDEENPKKAQVEIFQCPKCDSNYILKDSEGKSINIVTAKKNFLIKQSLKTKGSIIVPEIEEGFDEITLNVLKTFGSTTSRTLKLDQFTGLLKSGVKPVRISHGLDLLHKRGYITRYTQGIVYVGDHLYYELTPKGRQYLVDNNIM